MKKQWLVIEYDSDNKVMHKASLPTGDNAYALAGAMALDPPTGFKPSRIEVLNHNGEVCGSVTISDQKRSRL